MKNLISAALFCTLVVVNMDAVFGAALPLGPKSDVGLAVEPDGLEAVAVASTAINLYWDPDRYEEVENISILRGGEQAAVVKASEGYYQDSGLLPDTLYTYRIAPVIDGNPDIESAGNPVTEKTYPPWRNEAAFDVIVVGGTASGVAAARAAAMFGSTVALIEETNRLGGMSSNGLGRPDIREGGIRANGFFQQMRKRVIDYYGGGNGLAFEPKVANAVVKSLLYEYPAISIYRNARASGVIKSGNTITGVKVSNVKGTDTASFYAPVVIDATIEGDVAAAAGADYRVGREARSAEEPHNGHIYYDNQTDTILPGSTGKADRKVQSYAYLMTVKDYGPGEDRSIPEPPDYDKNNYIHSPEWTKTWNYTSGRLPNNKYEVNQHPWGTDLPGINYNYPEGSMEERLEIERRYKNHALGYLYYLQTEQGLKHIGLADDEYHGEIDCFPPTLYVREARRIEGLRVLKEWDVWKAREITMPDSIAIGDYPMDSHAVSPVEDPNARHRGEGEWWLVRYTPWYHAPLDVVVPKKVRGLLVSSAVSATHVAYGTLRMEPVRMSLGEAAGVTAHIARTLNIDPSAVPPALVQERLLSIGTYITWYKDVMPKTPRFEAIQFLGVRGMWRDEEFKPDDPLTRLQAIEWINFFAHLEGKNAVMIPDVPESDSTPVTRGDFALWLVESGQSPAAAEAFNRAGDTDEVITRAEGAYGLYLAHRDYALGPRAFSERLAYVREKEGE